jgi:hypothetical protein
VLEKIGGELEGDQNVILSAREDWRGAGQEGDQNFILSERELVRKGIKTSSSVRGSWSGS